MRHKFDDPDDESIAEKTEDANDEHAGDDQVGLRNVLGLRNHGTQTDRDTRHLADDQQRPSQTDRDSQASDNAWQSGRKHHFS